MKVVVYGANGWTGSLVAKTLDRRGHQLVLAGRNSQKLERLGGELSRSAEIRIGDIRNRADLVRIFDGADVVVPCAGPYRGFGAAAIEAALDRRCHYFDVSGEYEFVDEIYNHRHEEIRKRGLTFCPGFAVKGVLGDWLASIAARRLGAPIREVAIAYAHALREYLLASPGSMVSAAAQGLFYQHDRYDRTRSTARRFEFPAPLGAGTALLLPMTDEATIHRHIETPITRTYVTVAPGTPVNTLWATFFATNLKWMPALSSLMRAHPDVFKKLNGETRTFIPTETSFGSMAEVSGADGRVERAGVTLEDGYQATADLIACGIDRLASAPRGAITPTGLCEPRSTLRALCREHGWKAFRRSEPA